MIGKLFALCAVVSLTLAAASGAQLAKDVETKIEAIQ